MAESLEDRARVTIFLNRPTVVIHKKTKSTTKEIDMQCYFVDEDQMKKLGEIYRRLHSGSDAMRDEGHKLWLLCGDIANQEVPVPTSKEST